MSDSEDVGPMTNAGLRKGKAMRDSEKSAVPGWLEPETIWDRDFRAIVAGFFDAGLVRDYKDTSWVGIAAVWADEMAKVRKERRR